MKTPSKLKIRFILVLLAFNMFNNQNHAFGKDNDDDKDDGDFEDKNTINICCSWGAELADGIITYSIDDEDDKIKESVKDAANSWNKAIKGLVFREIEENGDITILFRDDGKKIAGKTVNYFDNYGFIRKSIITISEESYNHEFSPAQIEQVAKHELGHTLGLGHANFNGNLMTDRVDTGSGTISSCEIEAVKTANSWKLKEGGHTLHYPPEENVKC
jgi:hypothetical protein